MIVYRKKGVGEPNILIGPNRNPPNFTILDKWLFESFIFADKPYEKALQMFETCVTANKSIYGKLVLSL